MSTDGDFMTFEGNQYRRGFLYKWFPLNIIVSIITFSLHILPCTLYFNFLSTSILLMGCILKMSHTTLLPLITYF